MEARFPGWLLRENEEGGMPKLTLLLGRKTMQVFDLSQDHIVVGRDDGADILIDNPSVSRRHAEFRMEEGNWVVEDLGSSNGTFMGGQKIEGPRSLQIGDEVGLGKFSIVFGKEVGEATPAAAAQPGRPPVVGGAEGTMHIQAHEVQALLKDSERKKRAHLIWESGGQKGQHYLSEAPAVLVGTDGDLCDVVVPKGPKHHVLIINTKTGCDVRYLAAFGSVKVNGQSTKRSPLKDGDVVDAGGLTMTFVGDIS